MNFFLNFFSALALGAMHSLEPGHGKGFIGAYLTISRGRLVDALVLGISSAATHTAMVIALAITLHTAVKSVSGSMEMGGHDLALGGKGNLLTLISGLLIIAIGLVMLRRALRHQTCACGGHGGKAGKFSATSPAGALMVGITNGLIPCPGAVAVLLMSLNTNTLFSGLMLVLAFGIGGAISMVAVGMLFVRASNFLGRGARWEKIITCTSALLIISIGIATIYKIPWGSWL